MNFPERFSDLPEYAFPRLRALLDHHPAGGDVLHMTIGEPKHPFPEFIKPALLAAMDQFGNYPNNNGTDTLLGAQADWLNRRYGVSVDPTRQILALSGTREGLFNACIALCPEQKGGKRPIVMMPNPFYQVYAVAAETAGAEIVYAAATAENGFMPDFAEQPAEILDRTTIVYICSPSNPQGAVATQEYWRNLIGLAEKHDFQIFADECYSEIYRDTPPTGAMQIAHQMGADPERVLVFHSLSKRSNLPGLRSGFVAGGRESIARMRQLRAYAGAPPPGPLQAVAAQVWADEAHVVENRALYAPKFELADRIFGNVLGYLSPQAGFFLWLPVEDGVAATMKLWTETGVRVLPGSYLSRDTDDGNPGQGYIRAALVAPMDEVERGLRTIHNTLYEVD